MAQSDNQLIRDIVKGNEAAMELLVKRHYTMVHSFVYRMIGEYEISYDLTQEIFIKMMKNIDEYDNRSGEFSRWILRIASNHCKDYFRSPTYRQRMEHKDINNMEISLGDTVIDMFEKNERRKEIIGGDIGEEKEEMSNNQEFFDDEIESFLASYSIPSIEDKKIEDTVDVLREYMPKKVNKRNLLNLMLNEITYINKTYWIIAGILVVISAFLPLIFEISSYYYLSLIGPIPMILGISELIKGREDVGDGKEL